MYFVCKAHHRLLALRGTKQHLSTTLEGHLNTGITNKIHKIVKYGALNRLWKEYLFTGWELKQGSRRWLFDHRGELVSQATQIFTILCMSMTDQSAMNTGFQVTNRLYWVCKFASTESINNEHKLFYVLCAVWNIGYPATSK